MQPFLSFGEILRAKRVALGYTLRGFCRAHGFVYSYMSILERGLVKPPHDERLLRRYAVALKLKPGSSEWTEFMTMAELGAGRIPSRVLTDRGLAQCLPFVFLPPGRKRPSRSELLRLIERLRRSS